MLARIVDGSRSKSPQPIVLPGVEPAHQICHRQLSEERVMDFDRRQQKSLDQLCNGYSLCSIGFSADGRAKQKAGSSLSCSKKFRAYRGAPSSRRRGRLDVGRRQHHLIGLVAAGLIAQRCIITAFVGIVAADLRIAFAAVTTGLLQIAGVVLGTIKRAPPVPHASSRTSPKLLHRTGGIHVKRRKV